MKADEVLEYLERLALVKFDEREKERLKRDVEKILELFRKLDEVPDLDKYEPLFHVLDKESHLRDDVVDEELKIGREELEINAYAIEDGYIRAPRTVVEE